MTIEDPRRKGGGSTAAALFSLSVFCLRATTAMLAPCAAAGFEFSSEVGAGVTRFQFKELTADGGVLVSERGDLPAIHAGFALARDAWELQAHFDRESGSADYRGVTQRGAPLSTSTHERVDTVSAIILWRLAAIERWQSSLYGGAGYREWRRDIRSTATVQGLKEEARWGYATVGGRLAFRFSPKQEVAIDARLMRPFSAKTTVDFGETFDRATLRPETRTGWRTSLPWRLALSGTETLRIEPYYERWSFGRSPALPLERRGVVVGTVSQPANRTAETGVRVVWEHRF